LVGGREASLDAENDLSELVLQPDLAAGHGRVMVRAEAPARHTDDLQCWISIREEGVGLRPDPSRMHAEIETAPVVGPLVDHPAARTTVGLRQSGASECRDGRHAAPRQK
jgi:hypothetical protein